VSSPETLFLLFQAILRDIDIPLITDTPIPHPRLILVAAPDAAHKCPPINAYQLHLGTELIVYLRVDANRLDRSGRRLVVDLAFRVRLKREGYV